MADRPPMNRASKVKLSWRTHMGEVKGLVLHKQLLATPFRGDQIDAPRAEPQYIVKSDNGGKQAPKP